MLNRFWSLCIVRASAKSKDSQCLFPEDGAEQCFFVLATELRTWKPGWRSTRIRTPRTTHTDPAGWNRLWAGGSKFFFLEKMVGTNSWVHFGLDFVHGYQGSRVDLCLDAGCLWSATHSIWQEPWKSSARLAPLPDGSLIFCFQTWTTCHFRYLISLHSRMASTVCSWNWCNDFSLAHTSHSIRNAR